MNRKYKNVLAVGVGGQGLITFGRVLAEAAILNGTRVLTAEVHGMAQRGGSVVTHIRLGDVESPLIPLNGAHVIVSMELLEAARYINYANRETILILNKRLIRPNIPGVKMPKMDEIIEKIKSIGLKTVILEADELAEEAGSYVSANMVMLGALLGSKILDGFVKLENVEKVISKMPEPWREINIKALKLGYSSYSKNSY
ncbi:MAG: indolepyruvate oxidoreductase subunit beta [Candidatus Odinarchaeota archaeon]|nr:indolepyruvate oxidoreductase subunit beta [Candidatus Odinarchaeota archaeon]